MKFYLTSQKVMVNYCNYLSRKKLKFGEMLINVYTLIEHVGWKNLAERINVYTRLLGMGE